MQDPIGNSIDEKWSIPELSKQLKADLLSDSPKLGRWIGGRVVGLLTDPNSDLRHMAVGVSALSEGSSTPTHSHVSEELAIVLSGVGEIQIEDRSITVREGDVVSTPSGLEHRTKAGNEGPLTILWVYAPPDSATRWLSDSPSET